ncbi:MAG: TraX family protein [Candidatus Ventricola sp.]
MSAFSLRAAALLCMLIDHAGLALFPAVSAFRCVGRLAFPLYCFLLAQGYLHTRSVRAYARRLLLAALLSEIPFDLLIFGRLSCSLEQNALFSLLLALMALYAADTLRHHLPAACLAVGLLCLAAMAAHVSFGWLGIALCLCARCAQGSRLRLALGTGALLVLYTLSLLLSGVESGWVLTSLWALAAIPLLLLYNGRRGVRAPALTLLFYAAYPLHLAALAVLRAMRLVPPYFLS